MTKLFQNERTRAMWQIAVRTTCYNETGALLLLDLRYAYLYAADLFGVNLRDAYLSDANLRDANLSGADLSDANLRDANLSGADFSDANLYGADLRSANLSGAYLSGANLRGTDLSDVQFDDCVMNWNSHALISARLLQCEGTTEQHAYASLIAVKTDWCWKEWLNPDNVPRNVIDWALSHMCEWIRDGDNAPEFLTTNTDKE